MEYYKQKWVLTFLKQHRELWKWNTILPKPIYLLKNLHMFAQKWSSSHIWEIMTCFANRVWQQTFSAKIFSHLPAVAPTFPVCLPALKCRFLLVYYFSTQHTFPDSCNPFFHYLIWEKLMMLFPPLLEMISPKLSASFNFSSGSIRTWGYLFKGPLIWVYLYINHKLSMKCSRLFGVSKVEKEKAVEWMCVLHGLTFVVKGQKGALCFCQK